MPALSIIILVILAAVGLIYCFRGYRYLRLFMLLYGLYLGYTYTMRFFGNALGSWTWLLALGIGLVIGLLAFFFLKVAIFLAGGLLGVALYRIVQTANPVFFGTLAPGISFLIGLIFFIIFGAIVLAAKRTLIIVGTAFYGAYTFVEAIGILIGMAVSPATPVPAAVSPGTTVQSLSSVSIFRSMPFALPWMIVAVLAIVGIVAQYRTKSGKRKQRDDE